MYKIAVFDMDGTLLDTIEDLRAAVNYVLAELGFPQHDRESFCPFIGSGLFLLLQRALPEGHRDEATVAKAMELYGPYYQAHSADLTTAYPGMGELLAELREKGMRIGILSNKPHAFTVELAERYFPGMVDLAYGQRGDVPRKPDPAALHQMLEHFGLGQGDCVYIGDSDVDALTARNAGVDLIAVSWGYCPKDGLLKAGASVIVDKAADLLQYLVDK